MENSSKFPILDPNLQIGFYYRLKNIKDLYFHESLSLTVSKLKIIDIDRELNSLVSEKSLQKLASYSLRGELLFPIPSVLRENPFLCGYYRLLYGFSQKEFYSKGPFGKFKLMEEKGIITKNADVEIDDFCLSLIKTGEVFIEHLDNITINNITDLQILTVGPQLRGSKNNEYGRAATEETFSIIKEFVKSYITKSTPDSITIINESKREVIIKFSSDPDIEIIEKVGKTFRGSVSIEIKGGKDFSNIHNRIGEAEKSHQKAKNNGHREFITIINVDINYESLKTESPTTTKFFNLSKINEVSSLEYTDFREELSVLLGIR